MVLPNYKDGSIVNLMSSIKKSYGGKHPYKELRLLPSKDLKDSKNIVLIVLDGLGYEFIKKHGQNTVFEKGLKGSITSVFPSTTGSAIPTFGTGLPPQQHAFTGWFMFLKELGIVSTTLRFNPRIGGAPFSKNDIFIKEILSSKGFTDGLRCDSYLISRTIITKTDFTKAAAGESKILAFESLQGFFNQINKTIKSDNRKKFVYAYWEGFDTIAHKKGTNSREIRKHFLEINNGLSRLIKKAKDSNTTFIITADHGFINTTKKNFIQLKDHPEMHDCLTLPLCGDARIKYCYVKPSKAKKFEKYVKTNFKNQCSMHKSHELIDKSYFGLFKPNPKLFDRIGDYVLIMKENYVFQESIPGSKAKFKISVHSGISKEEMLVPLVVIHT